MNDEEQSDSEFYCPEDEQEEYDTSFHQFLSERTLRAAKHWKQPGKNWQFLKATEEQKYIKQNIKRHEGVQPLSPDDK